MSDELSVSIAIKFAANAEKYWESIRNGDSRGANATIKANEKLVASFEDKWQAEEMLLALLGHESERVRYASATHLVAMNRREEAIAVLKDLAINSPTLVSTSSKAIIRVFKLT